MKEGVFFTKELRSFFMGKAYPFTVAVMTVLSGIFGLEIPIGILHSLLIFSSACLCDSLKPMLVSLLSFVMQLSLIHTPFYPTRSDYLYTGWRIYALIFIIFTIVLGIFTFVFRQKIYTKLNFRDTPFLLPTFPFVAALLLNGSFSGRWSPSSLALGAVNVILFLFLPFLLYHGIREDSKTLSRYISYLSLLLAFVVISEMTALFISGKAIVDGSVNKVGVVLGFGIWNLIGSTLIVLIPMLFYGAHVSRYPAVYFIAASAVYVFALLSASRNAALVGGFIYLASLTVSLFNENRRKFFLTSTVVSAVLVLFFGAIFWKRICILFFDFLDRGFSDNGRFALWRAAIKSFLDDPIFGGGFYGFSVADSLLYPFGPLAKQAHNTVFQLLQASGLFGFAAYLKYRFFTLREALRSPDIRTVFASLSICALLLGSLLDNFIFNIYPTFYYSVCLVLIYKNNREKAEYLPQKIKQ